jgi:fermentation-respiration switch protein FrsA (DUF1100 family)
MTATTPERRNVAMMLIWALIWTAALLAGLYAASCLGLYVLQRRLIYFPDVTHYTPQQAGLAGVAEVRLTAPDGERLVAWHSPAASGAPTILYFHGNGGGLITRQDRIKALTGAGYGVFMLSYRGYAGSTGSPSEKAIVGDGVLAYDHLKSLGLDAARIVIYGESLGTGVASQVAAQRPAAAVILDAPFVSLVERAKSHYGFFPVDWLLTDRFNSIAFIGRINAPLLVLHGSEDEVIPASSSRALFEAAREPKEYVEFQGGGHSDLFGHGALERIRPFLAKYSSGSSQ